MWTLISFIVLIAAIVVMAYFLFCFSEKIDFLNDQLEFSDEIQEVRQRMIFDLTEKSEFLTKGKDRWFKIAKTLHSRIKNYSVGITRFKQPDTDIRVLQVYARDELAIELQKDGVITYKVKEHWREDLQETEVKVTASINVNKIK